MRRTIYTILSVLISLLIAQMAVAGLKDRLPPEAYLDPVDREIALTGKGVKGRPYPCARETTELGIPVVQSIATDHCVKMQPAQTWRGLWFNEFEGSRFCPTPAKTCAFESPGERIWLTNGPRSAHRRAVYAVEFLGRRTAFKGPYGHFGMSDYEIIVDQVLSLALIEAGPSPMTKAQLIAVMRKCEAEHTCIPSDEMRRMMNGEK